MELTYQKHVFAPQEGFTAEFIMRALQQTAEEHAKLLGFGRQALLSRENCVWMIARSSYELTGSLSGCRELTVETWPSGADSLQCYRGFYFYADGVLVGEASQSWLLVELDQRRILPTKLFPLLAQTKAPDRPAVQKLRHLVLPELTAFGSVTILSEDIDLNGHMNNARYLSYAMLPTGKQTAKAVRIDFERELVEGNTVTLLSSEQDGAFYVCGQMENGLSAFRAVIRA